MTITHTPLAGRNAIERLIDGFQQVPTRWFEDRISFMPMWGTLFLVSDRVDQMRIEKLLRPMECEAEDSDLAALSAAGWQDVGETGTLAIEFDDELLLGIHGAGYDFYEAHWSPLYDALGYSWHEVPA